MMKSNYLLGYPLSSSLSPQLHQWLYSVLKISANLTLFPCEHIERVNHLLNRESTGLLAVTMPHKLNIFQYCDVISDVGIKTQSVNTVFRRHGSWWGDNTDWVGIERTLASIELVGKKILILGAGGAGRTFSHFAAFKGGELFFYNRKKSASDYLAKTFSGTSLSFEALDQYGFDGIVNATPVGMSHFPQTHGLKATLFHSDLFVFDMVYNPQETLLIKQGKQAHAQTFSGLSMLIYQAIEQIRLWQQWEDFPEVNVHACAQFLKRYLL